MMSKFIFIQALKHKHYKVFLNKVLKFAQILFAVLRFIKQIRQVDFLCKK